MKRRDDVQDRPVVTEANVQQSLIGDSASLLLFTSTLQPRFVTDELAASFLRLTGGAHKNGHHWENRATQRITEETFLHGNAIVRARAANSRAWYVRA